MIVTVRLWLQIGFYMILFLAGLQRISPELYEAAAWTAPVNFLADLPLHHLSAAAGDLGSSTAAAVDQRLPGVRRVLQPARRTPPSARRWLYLYYTAQFNQDFGHGTAGAVILALLIMIVTLAQGRIFGFGRAE